MDRRYGDLRPEFVALGYLAEEALHGYELYRRFKEGLGSIWRISESQMYATLKRMERQGLVRSGPPESTTAAARHILSLSQEGTSLFNTWLSAPTVCSPRILRLEFLTRLYFAQRLAPSSVDTIFSEQRDEVVAAIGRLGTPPADRHGSPELAKLAASFSIRSLEAVLDWLDDEVQPSLPTLPDGGVK